MNTAVGLLAIIFFSTGVALSRSLSEQCGALTANAMALLLAGCLGIILSEIMGCSPLRKANLCSRKVILNGILFVSSQATFFIIVGLSSSRMQAIIIGLINYLWCGFSVLLSIPILNKKAKWFIWPGILIAIFGIILAVLGSNGNNLTVGESFKAKDIIFYGFAFIPALSWAIYSNLSRKWSGSITQGNVPLFLLFSGLAIFLVKPFFNENANIGQLNHLPELILMALVPLLGAYFFWNWGITKGNFVLIISCSYFTPILSAMVSCLYLQVAPTISLGIGAVMVLIGSVLCNYSISD